MSCPKCGKFSLRQLEERIICNFCGYKLSAGEETNFRLYRLLSRRD